MSDRGRRPDWFPDWSGQTCVIVASGPSAKDAPIEAAIDRARFMVINTSWRLAPWADILFACDAAWWNHSQGCKAFKGMKVTTDKVAARTFPDIHLVECLKPDDRLILKPVGTIGWGGNSGFHCLNLAVQAQCAKIILVGYDMTLTGGLHWHGAHPDGMSNPRSGNVERWRRAVDAAAKVIKPLGIKVINCSPVSMLQNYPKMTFEEALEA
jgi:hypothetical protein